MSSLSLTFSPRQDPPSGRAGGGSSPQMPDASVGQLRRKPGYQMITVHGTAKHGHSGTPRKS